MKAEFRLTILALALALTMTGCKGEKAPAAAGTAGGEILPGSASDAMLPVDSVRSQPPLAPRSEAGGGKPEKSGAKGNPAQSETSGEPVEPPAEATTGPAADVPAEPKPSAE